MARILPDPLVGTFTPEVLRVHRALRAIPGDDFMVWVGLPLEGSADRPHFLIVHEESTAFVVAVSGATESEVEEQVHGGLFAPQSQEVGAEPLRSVGELERARVRAFIAAASAPQSGTTQEKSGPPAVYGFVLFPNASHALLQQQWAENPADGCYWLGEEYMGAEKLAACFRRLAKGGLQERQLAQLRSQFSPETVVPPRFAARGNIDRNVAAGFTPLLLDYEQESWAKNRLRLSDEARAVAESPAESGEASLVTGVAGSGKSLVLLFRACTQAKLDGKSRALVLTHNKALRFELEARFGELGRPANVEWHNFFSWVSANSPRNAPEIFQYKDRTALVIAASRASGAGETPQWIQFLEDEFDWMQDRGVTEHGKYLAVERVGRGVRLTSDQREQVHRIYVRYVGLLKARNGEDWSGRALRFWRAVEARQLRLTGYDYIYVDEAQFFAPIWLRTLRMALKPNGRLLLAADPTQGFLKRRQSWVACGLDLRGRSTRLRKSYRNTREILEFAAQFYRTRLAEEEESDINLPDGVELSSAEPGDAPSIIALTSRQDEVTRVINEVNAHCARGGSLESVLVLVAIGQQFGVVYNGLAEAFGESRVADARKTSGQGRLRVCTIDAGTGLEAPVVFVMGGAELLEREGDLQMSADQRGETLRDNTRRLYMGFTRAGMKLFVTWVGKVPDMWQERLGSGRSSVTAKR